MIGKKFKIKGGLLSDIVSPEELEKMTTAAKVNPEENKVDTTKETKPVETEPKTENTEDDDASWKSRVSEPATENTDDGNQGCKKASNQNEYADEIGLVEAEEIVTNLEDKVESGEIEDENSVEVVESMQDALTATEEVIEQKEIIDEAAENNELTPTAVSIFKEQCENYLKEVNGSQLSEDEEEIDYIESESAGLESDSQQQLKAKYDAIWNTTNSTVKEVFAGIRKAHTVLGK